VIYTRDLYQSKETHWKRPTHFLFSQTWLATILPRHTEVCRTKIKSDLHKRPVSIKRDLYWSKETNWRHQLTWSLWFTSDRQRDLYQSKETNTNQKRPTDEINWVDLSNSQVTNIKDLRQSKETKANQKRPTNEINLVDLSNSQVTFTKNLYQSKETYSDQKRPTNEINWFDLSNSQVTNTRDLYQSKETNTDQKSNRLLFSHARLSSNLPRSTMPLCTRQHITRERIIKRELHTDHRHMLSKRDLQKRPTFYTIQETTC